MKDIIRMNQLAGVITEGQARKMMEVLDEEDPDFDALKNYLETNAAGMEVLDEPGSTVYFEFWGESFEDLLNKLNLYYKRSTERDGGQLVTVFNVDKAGIKQLLGKKVDEMATLNEANPDLTKFKNYLNKKSFGMEVLDEPGPNIYFEFWTPAGSQAFEDLLNKLSLKFKKNTERDGGKLVTMYYVDKASAKQLFGK
jgi:hypothetical protein